MSEAKSGSKKDQVAAQKLGVNRLEVIQYILEMRFLTPVQIQKKFFNGEEGVEKAQTTSFVLGLIKEGILKTYKEKELQYDSLVMVTDKGQKEIAEVNPGKIIPSVTKSIFPFGVNHDLALNDLRIRFEELGFVQKWVSDAHMAEQGLFLREFGKDRPDAVVKKPNGKAYFLELEKSKKGTSKYRERLEHYIKVLEKEEFKKAEIEGVIFFCMDEAVVEVIKSQIPEGTKGISVLKYSNYFKERSKKPKEAPDAKGMQKTSAQVGVNAPIF